MPLPYNEDLKERSRYLRDNLTDAERCLWAKLRMRQLKGYQFNRQKPIGNYIVDFFCHEAKLVIEVDGGQHFSGEIAKNDMVRDEYLSSLGLNVIRFNNHDVLTNIEGVVESILENMSANENDKNPPNPPLKRGR